MTNQSTEKKNYVDHQIIRIDGKDCFVEVMKGAFGINRVVLNFITYDNSGQKGSKKKDEISIFIDVAEFLQLAQDMKSGRLSHLAKSALETADKGGYKFAREIYTHMGGVSKEKLAQRNQSRADGMDLARQFKITPGSKQPWILSAETGPGKATDKGLIAAQYGNKPEKIIRVPMSNEHFKQLFLLTEMYIQGYINAKMQDEFAEAKNKTN